MPLSSPGGLLLPSRIGAGIWWSGALLVFLFNVKWGCYAQAGVVEVSEFCLFLVVFPTRRISSVSPRFYFRKHDFCFLPLVAILESPLTHQFKYIKIFPDLLVNFKASSE
jgi:hypothetical protein